jgi:hypothetical protein
LLEEVIERGAMMRMGLLSRLSLGRLLALLRARLLPLQLNDAASSQVEIARGCLLRLLDEVLERDQRAALGDRSAHGLIGGCR